MPKPSAGENISPHMQKLSLALPRLGSARHMAVPQPLCTRCIQQKPEKPLLATAVPFLSSSEHEEACSPTTSLEAGIGARHLSAGLSLGQGPGPWLLPWLGLKRSWFPGTEHQLGLGSLRTDEGKKDHLKLLQSPTVTYYPSWPAVAAGEAGSMHPGSPQRWRRGSQGRS